ncbi:GCN5-related N-acetyltransferase [Crenothrix polyspora]|uniref:GCN5-related N-acetyltransferase n=1 Tax=Crenothrix polyspora TaxID=360316 RepID=A0A1R4HFJ1_9GAMM|nr:GNAT family N-acetyltransferase [Crenothrix polyspora]SJM95018.1 GCN5-related N-acetyltransferase [Crenothrix polyspora]
MTKNPKPFSAPAVLTVKHDCEGFQSGEETLDSWLRERALTNMELAATRTYVICPLDSRKVIGYYALCMGQILNKEALGSMRRNMPHHIPSVILGRLAIDQQWQKKGLGGALLHDAVQRSARAAQEISARLLVVHTISPAAEAFYVRYGFARLPVETPTYALDLVKLANLAK